MCVTCCVSLCHRWRVMSQCRVCHMLCVIMSQMACDVTLSVCHRWRVMSQYRVCHMLCVLVSHMACDVTVSCVSHVVCHCVIDGM